LAVRTVSALVSAKRPWVLLWLCGHRPWLFALHAMVSLQKHAVMLQLPLLGQDGFPATESFPAAALNG